jgi:hypothetical protein
MSRHFAEVVTIGAGDRRWRVVSVVNVRAGAVFALAALVAVWRLASAPDYRRHRSNGTDGRARSRPCRRGRSPRVTAAAVGAVTEHLGGLLVWGARVATLVGAPVDPDAPGAVATSQHTPEEIGGLLCRTLYPRSRAKPFDSHFL